MCIAIEGLQLPEVNFHQLLDIYKQQTHRIPLSSKYIYLFHEILGGGGGGWRGISGCPTSGVTSSNVYLEYPNSC